MSVEKDSFEQNFDSNPPFIAGLAILVNTCCPLTQAYYAKFCNHVTAVSLFDKDLVPVTNRYALVESKLNSFMHGYVLGIPRRHDSFASPTPPSVCFYSDFT